MLGFAFDWNILQTKTLSQKYLHLFLQRLLFLFNGDVGNRKLYLSFRLLNLGLLAH